MEKARKKEEREARRAQQKALKEETERLEKEARQEREHRRATKARRRFEEAKVVYEERWSKLLSRAPVPDVQTEDDQGPLSFEDVPWPIVSSSRHDEDGHMSQEDINAEAISRFLLSVDVSSDANTAVKPSAKEILRSTMLKFHPDKFESRVLARVRDRDKDRVRETANSVVRILNTLMKENADRAV